MSCSNLSAFSALTFQGTGLIGSAFLRQLDAIKSPNLAYNVVLIARSNRALISKDFSPLEIKSWETDLAKSRESLTSTGDIAAFLERSPHPVILVDNTSSQSLANSYPLLISQGISIATPNKKAFSSDIGLWNSIKSASARPKGGLVYHEATVGCGLPIISTLNDLIATGDEITQIQGVVSGTLSYVFNEFSKIGGGSNLKFSEVLSKAKELGVTEPDPREDLNGMDVARKMTILSRMAGHKVSGPDFLRVQSIIPKAIRGVETAEEFLAKLPQHEGALEKLRNEAEAENKVLRYIGKLDMRAKPIVKIGLEKYDHSGFYFFAFARSAVC